jgi:hypothetical protein
VVACDPYARVNEVDDFQLFSVCEPFFTCHLGKTLPHPEWITRVHEPVEVIAEQYPQAFDMVLSSSVFEHVAEPESAIKALAGMTKTSGFHLHFIDLRDHYFKRPFEMLCYSESVWNRWLNPGSNLNRWRYPQYVELFKSKFRHYCIDVLDRDLRNFEATRDRIRPEFISGNVEIDTVTRIRIMAQEPLPRSQLGLPLNLAA